MKNFRKENIIPNELYDRITEIRVHSPGKVRDIAQKRQQRNKIAPSGYINIVAADHPARGSTAVGEDAYAMADRRDLLARLVYVLQSEWLDGILGSIDLLEDLLILHELSKTGGKGLLDEKVMIASLNRGGHPGTAWELDDPITGADAELCSRMNIDAAKMLLRMDPSSKDSLKTLMECVRGVKDMSSERLPIFLEPLPVRKEESGYHVIEDADLLVELVSITAALGSTSQYTWLKLPFTEGFEKVVRATTLPIVILGGGKRSDTEGMLGDVDKALRSGAQVRGTMFGRNMLYPDAVDSRDLANAIGQLVHGKKSLNEVVKQLNSDR